MNYKYLYIEFAKMLGHRRCEVCDYDYWGYCSQTNGVKAMIIIKPKMTYKEKYFTLVHETGHLFTLNKNNRLVWSKKTRNEDEANYFASQILTINKINVLEYSLFYDRAKKAGKRRKKAWHEFV